MSGDDLWINIDSGISRQFLDPTAHRLNCKCKRCRAWWLAMGPDPETGDFGPFGDTLWDVYAALIGESVEDLKAQYKDGLRDAE